MRLDIERDESGYEIHNGTDVTQRFRPHSYIPLSGPAAIFPPGARMVRWTQQVPYREFNTSDGFDATSQVNGGYADTPTELGWFRPWGAKYGGVTGGEDIDMCVTANSPQELDAFYRKAERILDRMPDRGFKINGYARFDWQHIRRATGTIGHLADRGDEMAQRIMVRWACEWIDDHADQREARQQFVEDFPGVGVKVGRDHGWGLLLLLSAYRYSGRRAFLDEAHDWFDIIDNAQTPCGLIQRTTSDKLYGSSHGKVGFWQSYEHAFLMNAAAEWAKYARQLDHAHMSIDTPLLHSILRAGTVDLLNSAVYDEARGGVIKNVAHGGPDPTTPSLCSGFHVQSSGIDTHYAFNLFSMAYRATGDWSYMEKGMRHPVGSPPNAQDYLELLGSRPDLKPSRPRRRR